jgi:hypothetical protein
LVISLLQCNDMLLNQATWAKKKRCIFQFSCKIAVADELQKSIIFKHVWEQTFLKTSSPNHKVRLLSCVSAEHAFILGLSPSHSMCSLEGSKRQTTKLCQQTPAGMWSFVSNATHWVTTFQNFCVCMSVANCCFNILRTVHYAKLNLWNVTYELWNVNIISVFTFQCT